MDITLFGRHLGKDELVPLVKKHFGEVLIKLRKERRITQEKLSERSGLDTTYISHLENGKKQASISTILLIASALNIPSSQLMDEIEVRLKK